MTVRPIDLQLNIGQINEVAKAELAKHQSVLLEQYLLDEESEKKSKLVNTKVDENKKGEGAQIKDEHKQNSRQGGSNKRNSGESEREEKHPNYVKDERLGNIIDIKQ